MANHRHPRDALRFSLGSLLLFIASVAVVLGMMSVIGGTHRFRSLGSVHAYLALLPVAAVWIAYAIRVLKGRTLIVTSLALYVGSLVSPALRLDGDLLFGIHAGSASIVGPFMVLDAITYGGQPISRWIDASIGCFVNAGYLVCVLFSIPLTSPLGQRRCLLALSAITVILAVVVLVPLALTKELDNIYIGYGAWVAAMLAMWLGAKGTGIIFD